MELRERQKQILQAIIEDYITTAMPIGSRSISKNFALSSATIRNEMSDLEEMGYLEQPHASAGRVPSDKAYRFYVDNLLKMSTLSKDEMEYVRSYYKKRIDETHSVLSGAARAISDLTQYVSVIMPPKVGDVLVSGIQLMPINPSTAMVVVLTDTGMLQNMPIVLPRQMRNDELEGMSRLLNNMFAGKPVGLIHPGAEFMVDSEIEDQRQIFDAICTVVEQKINEADGEVLVGGTSNLLVHQEYSDMHKVRSFLQLIEEKRKLKQVIDGEDMEIRIKIGEESGIGSDYSIVTATYSVDDKTIGKIGVIGPTRMQYKKVLSVLDYIGKAMTQTLSGEKQLEEKNEEGKE